MGLTQSICKDIPVAHHEIGVQAEASSNDDRLKSDVEFYKGNVEFYKGIVEFWKSTAQRQDNTIEKYRTNLSTTQQQMMHVKSENYKLQEKLDAEVKKNSMLDKDFLKPKELYEIGYVIVIDPHQIVKPSTTPAKTNDLATSKQKKRMKAVLGLKKLKKPT